jgi:hypothetical protein
MRLFGADPESSSPGLDSGFTRKSSRPGMTKHTHTRFLPGSLTINLVATADWQDYIGFAHPMLSSIRSFVMFKRAKTIAIALFVILAAPAASFARVAGEAGMGNVPISGIPAGPANVGGMNNASVDPSGIGNASKVAPIPPPRITVPVVPRFK